jgi:hypothetical protein
MAIISRNRSYRPERPSTIREKVDLSGRKALAGNERPGQTWVSTNTNEVQRMLLGLALFWFGAVLCLNGIWLLGKIGDREIAVINVFVGFVTLLVSLDLAFGPGANRATIKAAALTLLFTFTYFWVAWDRWNGADGRGLGWFCLFIAITTIPVFLQTFSASAGCPAACSGSCSSSFSPLDGPG